VNPGPLASLDGTLAPSRLLQPVEVTTTNSPRGSASNGAAAQTGATPAYDLLIRGGRVIDPSQGLSTETDVAIRQGKVARIAPGIAESEARQVLDSRKMIVTPGLVDIHVHVYDGVAPLGIPADPNCIAKGASTVVDAGSAGASRQPAGVRSPPTAVHSAW
jgi:N-acyl-D-aspartate/D-glutamate deacylase